MGRTIAALPAGRPQCLLDAFEMLPWHQNVQVVGKMTVARRQSGKQVSGAFQQNDRRSEVRQSARDAVDLKAQIRLIAPDEAGGLGETHPGFFRNLVQSALRQNSAKAHQKAAGTRPGQEVPPRRLAQTRQDRRIAQRGQKKAILRQPGRSAGRQA
jgi:hypothetical protein